MDLGACPRCGCPYTAADVAGLGILRARPAAQGGPLVEYRCPRCARIAVLVPHGEGRYAPPGEAPPPPVPEQARRPHWVGAAQAAPPPPPASSAPNRPAAAPPPEPVRDDQPLSPGEALALLGVSITASPEEVERAFRAKSLTCHPDKLAHLDPELQQLAERKFKRLLEAYRLLRR